MQQIARQIHKYLQGVKNALIVPHQNPDGDAIGSALALAEYLENSGIKPTVFCVTPLQPKFHFLPRAEYVSDNAAIFQNQEIDTIIVLDSGDLRYAGIDKLATDHPADIINIDHHPTNEKYGHINLVVPRAAATAEIIYHFFKYNGIRLSHRMATALLTGIITDTDNFTNPATSTSALQVAGALLRQGGNLKLINNHMVKNKTINSLKLWGEVLVRLNKQEGMNLAYTYITQADLKKHDVGDVEAEGIANFLNNLDGADISLILKETAEGKIKGSFRTIRDDIDVAALARKFGGGGHKKAAGFTTGGTMEEILNRILTDK